MNDLENGVKAAKCIDDVDETWAVCPSEVVYEQRPQISERDTIGHCERDSAIRTTTRDRGYDQHGDELWHESDVDEL